MRATIYPIKAGKYRLAIVARPRGNDWLGEEVAAFSQEGIDVLVSMLTPEEAHELGLVKEEPECTGSAIKFVNVPMVDRSVPVRKQEFLASVDFLAGLVRDGRFVGVHCRASIGRSSLLAASLLVRLGWNPDEAFKAIELARGCPVPDTPEQRNWVISNVAPPLTE